MVKKVHRLQGKRGAFKPRWRAFGHLKGTRGGKRKGDDGRKRLGSWLKNLAETILDRSTATSSPGGDTHDAVSRGGERNGACPGGALSVTQRKLGGESSEVRISSFQVSHRPSSERIDRRGGTGVRNKRWQVKEQHTMFRFAQSENQGRLMLKVSEKKGSENGKLQISRKFQGSVTDRCVQEGGVGADGGRSIISTEQELRDKKRSILWLNEKE